MTEEPHSDAVMPLDSAPPPVPPEVVSRDAAGRVTVRAVRAPVPLRIDGRLDEEIYGATIPVGGFIQIEPTEGAPESQRTEFWLLFDSTYVYFSARVWEASPERMLADEMRHDAVVTLSQNDNITVALDTFYDRRNGYSFTVNPVGGRAEGQHTNERQYNTDWNGIWDVKVGRFDGGWSVEMAIPFKSLRYRTGKAQLWGVQVVRSNRWKNEVTFLTPMTAARGSSGFMLGSLEAALVGLEAPPPARNLEIKPYAVTDLTTDRTTLPPISNDPNFDAGVDVKYGIRQSLALDLTYNPDFAQVEADEQQVNLTRFSLFFPEKREFFLENQGTFSFGGLGTASAGDAPILFYSRQIGLDGAREVPLVGGARLTGRTGRYNIGGLNIQARDQPESNARATNFTALRVKRDILRRSAIGLIGTNRSVSTTGSGSNQAVGLDGTFGFFTNLTINTYWARTWTNGLHGDDKSYRAQLDYAGDRYGLQLEHLLVGDQFNPEVGFVRRDDMRKSYVQARFSPRPGQPSRVRKYSWTGSGNYIENTAGRVDLRDFNSDFSIEFQSSDKVTVGYQNTYEYLPQPFRIAPGVVLPIGGYDYATARAGFNFGQQRKVYGNVTVERGTFYTGHRTTVSFRSSRVRVNTRLAFEPTFSVNDVDLSEGAFQTNLVGSRVTYTMTPRMFVTALVQYNSTSHSLASNVRLRWEYQPGSELFVVYNDQRNTLGSAFPDLTNRALVVKVNRLFRF